MLAGKFWSGNLAHLSCNQQQVSQPLLPEYPALSPQLSCYIYVPWHWLAMAPACNGTLDEEVGDQTGVGQQGLGDPGGGVVLQPILHGSHLICVPICSYHRLHHHCLQSRKLLSLLKSQCKRRSCNMTACPMQTPQNVAVYIFKDFACELCV